MSKGIEPRQTACWANIASSKAQMKILQNLNLFKFKFEFELNSCEKSTPSICNVSHDRRNISNLACVSTTDDEFNTRAAVRGTRTKVISHSNASTSFPLRFNKSKHAHMHRIKVPAAAAQAVSAFALEIEMHRIQNGKISATASNRHDLQNSNNTRSTVNGAGPVLQSALAG